MKKSLTLLTLLCLALPASAADWVRVATDATGTHVYLDRASISNSHGLVQYWLKVLYKDQKSVPSATRYYKGQKVWYMLYKSEEDCRGNSPLFPMEESVLYGLKGQVLHTSGPSPSLPSGPVPDTVGEAVHNAVCGPTVARRLIR